MMRTKPNQKYRKPFFVPASVRRSEPVRSSGARETLRRHHRFSPSGRNHTEERTLHTLTHSEVHYMLDSKLFCRLRDSILSRSEGDTNTTSGESMPREGKVPNDVLGEFISVCAPKPPFAPYSWLCSLKCTPFSHTQTAFRALEHLSVDVSRLMSLCVYLGCPALLLHHAFITESAQGDIYIR